jgi:hypothetical protein
VWYIREDFPEDYAASIFTAEDMVLCYIVSKFMWVLHHIDWPEEHRFFFYYVGFEVLTPVLMKSSVFWHITPCSPLKMNRRFGETPSSHSKNKPSHITGCHLLSRGFLVSLMLRPWRWRRHVPQKGRLTLNGLHGAVSQNIRHLLDPLSDMLVVSIHGWEIQTRDFPSGRLTTNDMT